MTNACWSRGAAWMGLLGLAACTLAGTGEPTETGSSGATSTSGTDDSVTATGGVFTLTSVTEGDESSAGTMGTTDATTTTATATTDAETTGTTAEGSSTSTGEPDVCPGLIADLTTALTAGARCELLLRVDDKGAPLGWHSVCGAVPGVEVYSSKDAIGATSCCMDAKLIGADASPFIFHQQPIPPKAGGVAIVSNHLGAVVFDGTIGVGALGTISIPAAWQSPESLGVGAGCGGEFTLTAITFDLSLGGPMDPPPLNPDALKLVSEGVAATALPAALGQVVIDRTVVLGYEAEYEAPGSTFVVLLELSQK